MSERVLFVEFQDGRPFDVRTTKAIYDFDYCKRNDCLYYDQSGGGIRDLRVEVRKVFVNGVPTLTTYWAAPEVEIDGAENGVRLESLPEEWTEDRIFANAVEGDTVYCASCDDWLPSEGDAPCRHVWWCERCGQWSTPSERSKKLFGNSRCKHNRRTSEVAA